MICLRKEEYAYCIADISTNFFAAIQTRKLAAGIHDWEKIVRLDDLYAKPVRMRAQNYRNHRRLVFLYHVVTLLAILILLAAAILNLVQASRDAFYSASLFMLISLILPSLYFFGRVFPLKVQDRAIRAEENLRHFILAGKPLDSRLTIRQIVALRFASDEEFVRLAKRAVDEALNNDEIKREIKSWRADYCRV